MTNLQHHKNGWLTNCLDALCLLAYGKNLAKNQFTPNGKHKVFGANGFIGYSDKFTHKDEEVLVSCRGEYSGKINMSEPLSFITNNSIPCLIKDKDKIHKKYLYYYLDSIPRAKFVSGSAQPQVVINDLKHIEVEYPLNLLEQQKIADILTKIDEAIEKTDQLIKKHERIKKGLMQDLLTKGIDENGNIRSEKTHEFKDSPLGRIPVDWSCTNIDELAEHVGSGITPRGGSSVYKKSGILFIRSQNVHNNGLLLQEVAFIDRKTNSQMQRSELKDNDVLLNITGASIGRSCMYRKAFGTANVNQHVCAIRLKDGDKNKSFFLWHFLISQQGQAQVEQYFAGSNREGLNYQQVRSFKLPWPQDAEEFEKIAKRFITINSKIEVEEKAKNKLTSLKKGLMEDLLTGKVRTI